MRRLGPGHSKYKVVGKQVEGTQIELPLLTTPHTPPGAMVVQPHSPAHPRIHTLPLTHTAPRAVSSAHLFCASSPPPFQSTLQLHKNGRRCQDHFRVRYLWDAPHECSSGNGHHGVVGGAHDLAERLMCPFYLPPTQSHCNMRTTLPLSTTDIPRFSANGSLLAIHSPLTTAHYPPSNANYATVLCGSHWALRTLSDLILGGR